MYNLKKMFNYLVLYISFAASSLFAQWSLDTVITAGDAATGIAITSDNSKIVVTNNTSPGSIDIISTSDYSITKIDISSIENYPNGVAISPDDSIAFVNTTHNTIAINLFTKSAAWHHQAPCAGTTLYGIAITPNSQSAVYPDLSSGCTQQGIRNISAKESPSNSSFISVNTSGVLYGIALSADGSSAVVTTFSLGSPKNINLLNSQVQNISGMNGSYGVAALHNSSEALIFDGDSLDRVSLTSNSITKKISALSYNTSFQNIAVTSDDKYAFAVGAFEKLVISLKNDSVIQTFSAGGTNVVCTSDGSRFFVTDSYNGTVRVYKKDATGIVQNTNLVLKGFSLEQNYPNPFNPSTEISYQLPFSTFTILKVYNVLGSEVCTLVNGPQNAGKHTIKFNAESLSNGVYFYRLQAGSFVSTKKLIILK